jgi:hypothetical protein
LCHSHAGPFVLKKNFKRENPAYPTPKFLQQEIGNPGISFFV